MKPREEIKKTRNLLIKREGRDGFNNFESFDEYLKKVDGFILENEELKDTIQQLENEKAKIVEYLEIKLEESKLCSYVDGVYIYSIQERIYQDILDRVEGKK